LNAPRTDLMRFGGQSFGLRCWDREPEFLNVRESASRRLQSTLPPQLVNPSPFIQHFELLNPSLYFCTYCAGPQTMAPLILHNVPDEELYVGEDGVQRPYAMVFPQYDAAPDLEYIQMLTRCALIEMVTQAAVEPEEAPSRRDHLASRHDGRAPEQAPRRDIGISKP
jgi:hypothetical protein